MEKVVVEIDAKVAKAESSVKSLKDVMAELTEAIKESNEKATETKEKVEDIGKASKKASKGTGVLAGGFKKLGTAIKATGIGLVIGLFASLGVALSRNQKIIDAFNTATETLGIIFSQVATALVNVYESVAKSSDNFNALGKVIKGLLNIAITPLKLSFYGIKLAIQEAQLIWEQSFFGGKDQKRIAELNISILETKNNILEVGKSAIESGKDVVNNFSEAIDEAGTIGKKTIQELKKISISAAIETAKTNVQLKNNAELAAAQQQLLVEKYDIMAEKLRQVRDEERNSVADRIKANNDLKKVLDEQEKAMLKLADMQIAAAQADVNKNKSIENQVKLTEALANKQGVLAQIEGFRSEQKMNDLALDKEQIDLTKTKEEAENKLSIERRRFNAEQIKDEVRRIEALKEIDAQEAEIELQRLQRLKDSAIEGTQAKIDADIAFRQYEEEARQKQITLENQLEEAKRNQKEKTFNLIQGLAGRETAIGRALLIAKSIMAAKESLIEAKKALNSALLTGVTAKAKLAEGKAATAKIGFPGNIIPLAIFAVQAAAIFSSVKSAISDSKRTSAQVSSGVGGGEVPSLGNIASSSNQSIPPAFNVVGQSQTSQLARTIADRERQPQRAYVVADDISSAQSLDRNIIEGASIG